MAKQPTTTELRRQFQDIYTRHQRTYEAGEQAVVLLEQRTAELADLHQQFADWHRAAGFPVPQAWGLKFNIDPASLVLGLTLVGAAIIAFVIGNTDFLEGSLHRYAPGLLLAGLVVTTWAVTPIIQRFDHPAEVLSDPEIAEKVDKMLARREGRENRQEQSPAGGDPAN